MSEKSSFLENGCYAANVTIGQKIQTRKIEKRIAKLCGKLENTTDQKEIKAIETEIAELKTSNETLKKSSQDVKKTIQHMQDQSHQVT